MLSSIFGSYLVHKNPTCFSRWSFRITERGKKRDIEANHISDRVVQKCLCRYGLIPTFQKSLIYDNGASQKGKGVGFARKRLLLHLRSYYNKNGNNGYVLRFDFKDYFGSIPHDIIITQINKTNLDDKIKELAKLFISQNKGGTGVGIGSEVSQVIGIIYANSVDHLIKDKLGCKYYARYMDDGYIIHQDKGELQEILAEINKQVELIGGKLSDKKTNIVKLSSSFTFMQRRYSLTETGKIYVKPNKKNTVRQRRKLKKLKVKYDSGEIDIDTICQSTESFISVINDCDAYHTVKSIEKLYRELFEVNKNVSNNKT